MSRKKMIKKIFLVPILATLFSGCVSVQTGLEIASFGVRVGMDIHEYASKKKEEAKEIISQDATTGD